MLCIKTHHILRLAHQLNRKASHLTSYEHRQRIGLVLRHLGRPTPVHHLHLDLFHIWAPPDPALTQTPSPRMPTAIRRPLDSAHDVPWIFYSTLYIHSHSPPSSPTVLTSIICSLPSCVTHSLIGYDMDEDIRSAHDTHASNIAIQTSKQYKTNAYEAIGL